MTYTVTLARPARKFLDKLARAQPKHTEAIEDAIDQLADDPRPHGCTPLKGMAGVWRIRVGDYRICYTIDDDRLVVLVGTISTRDDIYQQLRRIMGR